MVRTRNEDWRLFTESMSEKDKQRFNHLKAKFKQLVGRHFIDNDNGEEFVITKVGTRYVEFFSKTHNEELASRVDEFYKVFFSDWAEA